MLIVEVDFLRASLSAIQRVSKTCYKTIRKEAIIVAKVNGPTQNEPKPKLRPALSPETRENQLISLAYDLVEERLLNGTATSQETTYFLKLAFNVQNCYKT